MKNNILKSLFIALTLILGVINSWAVDHTGGYVYFLKPSTWTESKVMMFIGHNSYTSVYEMTKVANTDNLYRYTMPSWGGATYVAFANAGSVWGSGSWGPSNRTNAPHYTNVYNNYGFNSGSYYVVVPASTSNNAGITINYKSSASNLNLTTRANVYGSTDGGSTYASMGAAGTVSVSGYYMSNSSTASTRSAVSSTSSQAYASTTLAPGSTATFKATANTGYEFVGWFDAESGGTAVSTDATYTFKYDISYAGKTLYARFKQKQHTVLFGVHSSGHGSLTAKIGNTSISSNSKVNYGSTIVFTATPSTGYQIEGWYKNSDCTTSLGNGTNNTYTVTITGGTNVYVKFKANQYTITYKDQGGSNFSGTHASGYPTTHTYGTATTLKTASKTGYTFEGWYKESACTNKVTSLGATAYTANITLYAKWTPKTYTITLHANGGARDGSATATYNSSTITNLTHPTYTDYRCDGYYTATSGGTLVLNIDGTLAKSVSGYTDANGNWIKDEAVTLYAQWTYDVTEYTVTFGAGTGFTSYGSVTAYNNTTSASITSPATVRSGQNITFTATPQTGYEVEGWYTNAACTAGKLDAGQTTYTTFITAATNVYVKFVEKTWSVAFAASTGGTVTTPSSTPQTVGEVQGITIIAETKEGYTFAGWTSSNGGNFDDARAEKTDFYPTAATTVTANFTENLHTIAVQTSNNEHGTVSPASVEVGVTTTTEITATPNAGYMFDKWMVAGGATVADPTSAKTTVTATAEGSVTAYFKEIPPTTIYFKPNDDWKKDNDNFAINYWNNSTSGFADMTELDCEGNYYVGQVPTGFNDMKIQRVQVDPDTKYYITGNSDLVGQAKAWNEAAVEMTYSTDEIAFTYTFSNLAPGITYKMKLTNGSWANAWGYNALKNSSANITSDNDNNIVFKLPYGGDVVVKFDGTNVTISGFFVKDDATPQKYGSAVPGQCHDVMLQGFYWDSNQDKYYGNTRWSTLQSEAADISTYFDLLWLPPSAMSSGGVGYHPKQYSNQNSDWGSRKDLEKLISMLHAGGTKVVADMVVNHMDTKSSWCDFFDQDFGEYGYFQPDGSYICNDDEMNWDADEGCRGTATGSYDDGYGGEKNYQAARDMAHNDEKVRQMFRAYAKWMVDVMKYDGFRYDYAKGFHLSHVDDYNANAGVYFSVIEYWEGNPDALWSAICDANKNTYAFDFGMKFNIMNGAIANFNYGACKNPNALIGIGKGKWAVNFIDNHDTFERGNGYDFGGDAMSDAVKDRLLQAHAYILAMPGVPCVFYPYWKKYKNEIAPMVLARKAVGLHSESAVNDEVVGNGYRAYVTGTKGTMILELGAAVSDSHYGFREVAAGPGYKMFITYEAAGAELTVSPQSTYYRSQTMSVTMNAVGLAGVPDIYYTLDGTDPRTSASKKKYTGEISISGTVTIKAYAEIHGNQTAVQTHTYTYYPPQEEPLTVRFLPPNDWWTYVYAWDKNDNKLLGNWPGTKIDPNANGWVEYTFAAGKNPVNVIFHNNVGAQSHDIVLEEDACYIWDSSLNDAVLTNECNVIDTGSSAPADPEQGNTPKLLLDETITLTVPTDDKNLYDMDSENITHLYLSPNGNWKADGARFAAYFFGNGDTWVSMTDANTDGIYECAIPTTKSYPSVIFCRMNGSTNTNNWTNTWNQTNDLTVPTDGKNRYTIDEGAWSYGNGSWSTIYDDSKWTTFTAPTYSVTINITGYGSIEIDGKTYTNDSEDKGTYSAPNITLNELMQIGAITPANEWTYGVTPTIIIGSRTHEVAENTSYTICGTTIIDIIFSPSICEVVFNLNLPQGVPTPLWSVDNQRINPGDTVKAPQLGELSGYFFGGWYTHATDFSNNNQYDFGTAVTRSFTLYARWLRYEDCIFFKNNLGWESVYAYFYNSDKYWDDTKGTGSQKLKTFPQDNDAEHKPHWFEFQGELSNIPETDIWYLDFIAMAIAVDNSNWGEITGYTNISFTEHKQYDYEFFHQTSVVRRGDFNRNMSLFIPEVGQSPTTRNESKYYNHGLWMKYNSIESGYNWRGSANSWSTSANAFTADKAGGYTFTSLVQLTGGTDYEFKIFGNNTWFGNTGTMTEDNCTNWHFTNKESTNAKIHPTATGDYIFTIYVGDGKMMVSLEYPLSVGDYRLAYKDNTAGSFHPSHYIKKRNEGQNDTISFFVHHDKQPQIIVQQCSAIANDGTATWKTLDIGNVNPAAGLTETGVYNFYLQQIQGQTNPRLLAQTQPYTGNFYIRTESADGGWKFFRQSSNLMTYNSYADNNENFDHYFCKWVKTADRNVEFVVANDYSYCISDTLTADPVGAVQIASAEGKLPDDANVRFAWDSKTNELSRAYMAGANNETQNTFLHIIEAESLKNTAGDVVTDVPFIDLQNWIYQAEVVVSGSTLIKLVAEYAGKTQYFKGGTTDKIHLISSTANSEYKLRLIYNFKCNHLVAAVVLEGDKEITEDDVLGADLMVVRKDQGQAEQLTFNPNAKKLDEVGTAYAVMTFTRGHITNRSLPSRVRSLYWVSFPFDVKIADVFGFGEYAEHWIMQYYDGAERAAKGLFIDSGSYWKYIEDKNTTLQAGVGYVLALDLDKLTFPNNVNDVSLYFPSTGEIGTISGVLPTAHEVPAHECTIDREFEDGGKTYNHKFTDSHWNLIGVPGYADINDFDVTSYHFMQDDASFYYNFSLANSTYTVESSATNFQAMYAYMVQFAGDINWRSKTVSAFAPPASIAARQNSDSQPEKITLRLELAQAGVKADQTFVQLQQEGATDDFDMSMDLTKIINKGSNIYTLVGADRIQVAGNALPMQEQIVPVGVVVPAAGEYTFRMPDGTEGMVVELIDYENNTTTNLLLSDYTVTLSAGECENRFMLHIQPEKSGIATYLEQITTSDVHTNSVQKYLIDGHLYLKKDGILYDAQGRQIILRSR